MYSQNMSEKIARSLRSILKGEITLCALHEKHFKNFNVQDNSIGSRSPSKGIRRLRPSQRQQPLICLVIKTLPHIQQTQYNFRHAVAYSFSGANFL
jgi:hypothetical protein